MALNLILYVLLIPSIHAFVAFECGDGANNYTSISLLDVDPCNVETEILNEEEVVVQLLQPRESRSIQVRTCKISIRYIAVHCGMNSHNSIVKGGNVDRVLEISKDECEDLHRSGKYETFGHSWNRIRPNSTTTISVTFSGRNSEDGSCEGAYFSDGIHSWNNVMVEGSLTISINDFPAIIRYDKKEIRLRSGAICNIDSINCIDPDDGYAFWSVFPIQDCKPDAFHVLYRGVAKRAKVYDRNSPQKIILIYTVATENTLFTLSSSAEKSFCLIALKMTDHPKLLIHEIVAGNFFFTQEPIGTSDLDMFLYINAKFLHLEKTLSRTMRSMYHEIMEQKCELERTTLKTQLTLAITSPLEFAYTYMNGPGYTATVLGEIVYIIKCQPVDVQAIEHPECVKELPVSYKNKTKFMLPRSRVLQDSATPISCSTILKPQYLIGNNWYYSINALHSGASPQTLRPNAIPEWKHESLSGIATAGIYSPAQLDDLRQQIMAPMERKAKTERMAGILNGENILRSNLDLSSLIDKDYIRHEINGFWERCWNSFWYFGTTSAGLIGILLVFKLIKIMFDTVIHGIALYEIYGFTWCLIASIWDAATTFMIHRASNKKDKYTNKIKESSLHTEYDLEEGRSLNVISSDTNRIYPNLQEPIIEPYRPPPP